MKAVFFILTVITVLGAADEVFYFQWFTDPPPPLVYLSEPGVTKVSQLIFLSGELRGIEVYATPGLPSIHCSIGINKGGSQLWSGYLYHEISDPTPDYYSTEIFPSPLVDGVTWLSVSQLTDSHQVETDSDDGHPAINWMYSAAFEHGWVEYPQHDLAIRVRCYGTNPYTSVAPLSLSLIKALYKQ